jgi:Mg-chelatase subunit ChlD/uncharacterized membrane protein
MHMFFSFVYPNLLWLFLLVPVTVVLALLGRRRPTVGRFWAGLALRVFLLAAVILALAGLQVRRRADTLTAVFVLDVSDSVPAEEKSHGEAVIRRAVEAMPAGDKAAVVVFGQDALVERIASEDPNLPQIASVPVTARTDIASALQLAMALLPGEGAKRLVLLSDGRENVRQALAQAELAAAHQIELSYVPLSAPEGEAEVLVESLDAPGSVRQGQGYDLTVVVRNAGASPVGATLRVFGDGKLIHSQEVRLQEGLNRFRVPVEAEETGFRRFRAQIVPDADTRLQNNEASAFTVVEGPPRVALVEGRPGEGDHLARALRAAGMGVDILASGDVPTTLPEWAAYDAVILANVPAAALPPETMATLQVYVRDLGRGLMMAGGENAYGAGGYLRTPVEEALPVDMDVRTVEEIPNLALVLVIDKSGSMGRCHCDNPDARRGEYEAVESGQPKVDIAKEAIMRAASALGPQDSLGVVAFDETARWAVQVGPLVDAIALERSIGGLPALGQTNLRAGVEAAYESLRDVEARFKHVILMTDGWVREGELTPLAREQRELGITLSVVAAGRGSARYLEELAETGGGRYYPAVDILRVPDFFLKETVQAVGRYIIEEPFYPLPAMPSPILSGIDVATVPPLLGYNGTTPKGTARVALGTPRGDPLLATWQYGLGRAAAWTSDVTGRWAAEWVSWEGFPRFVSQWVGWTLPAPHVEGMNAQAVLDQDRALLRVEMVDADASSTAGRPRNFLEVTAALIGPDLDVREVVLPQVGAGLYEARVGLTEPGTYLVRVAARDGGQDLGRQTLGLVVPYSPEYAAMASGGTNRTLLEALARRTGGGELPEPLAAFAHNLPAVDRAREVWRGLLLAVALLFPLDIAIRRVMLGPGDVWRAVRTAWVWMCERLPARRAQATHPEQRALGRLFEARRRVRDRTARTRQDSRGFPKPLESREEQDDSPPPPDTPSGEEALARLREAKRRAQRGR